MKPKTIITFVALAALVLITVSFVNKSCAFPKQPEMVSGNGIAVLELFTSEGCSSCPAADALLAHVQEAAGDKPVYYLAYHVDYWDRLGWKDIFSSRRNSERQYQYSSYLNAQVYTPQLVINGQTECIGSDAVAVKQAIHEALNQTSGLSVTLQGRQQGQLMHVNYAVTGNAGADRLLVAVVQKQAISQVKRGENGGRTLKHAQIVQQFYDFKIARNNQGTVEVPVPAAFNAQEWEVIGWLQQPQTGAIHAATRVVLNNTVALY